MPFPLRNAIRCSSLVAFFTDRITQTQEAHGVLLNKHYEIPFEKEYAMGFPLSYSVTIARGCIASQVTIQVVFFPNICYNIDIKRRAINVWWR